MRGVRTYMLRGLMNYKKEYLNLFSSNIHEQAYRPRGCYFNCAQAVEGQEPWSGVFRVETDVESS